MSLITGMWKCHEPNYSIAAPLPEMMYIGICLYLYFPRACVAAPGSGCKQYPTIPELRSRPASETAARYSPTDQAANSHGPSRKPALSAPAKAAIAN